MSVRFDTVRAGDVLYDVRREPMGHVKMSRWGWYRVEVESVDHEKGEAMCSWNGNPATRYSRLRLQKLRRSIPKKLAEAQGLKTVTP